MNSVQLTGRLTKDPEAKQTQTGLSVCSFTIAVDRHVSNQQTADFIGCVAWRQSADYLSKYGHKGDMIELEGKIQTRNYDDKDGKRVYVTEIVADRLSIISGKKKTSDYPTGGVSLTRDDISKAVAGADPADLVNEFDTGADAGIGSDDLPF